MRDGEEPGPAGHGGLSRDQNLDKFNDTELRVWAPRRSGHHGVIIWLVGLFSGEVYHLNDVSLEGGGLHGFPRNLLRQDFRSRRDALILNFEDFLYEKVWFDVDIAVRNAGVRSGYVRDLLVLRDPYNLAASAAAAWGDHYLHWGRPGKERCGRVVDRWKMYAREFMHETRWLPDDTVMVSYNRWLAEPAYRAELAQRIGRPFSDEGFGIVCGAPSGFGKDVPLQERSLLGRWRTCAQKAWFREIVEDAEIARLARALFPGVVEEVERSVREG